MKSTAAGSLPVMAVKKSEPSIVRPAAPSVEASLANNCSDYYYLSTIDENVLGFFSILYVYATPAEPATLNLTALLKTSLAKVIAHYHPLAGQISRDKDGRLVVKLTAEGVIFVEAEAECTLAEAPVVLPNPETVDNLLYPNSTPNSSDDVQCGMPLLQVQVTKFQCGGFVLGIMVNHHVMDGTAAADFVKSWGEMARGVPLSNPPFLDRTIIKPRNPPKPDFTLAELDADTRWFEGMYSDPSSTDADVASKENPFLKGVAEMQRFLWFDADRIKQLKSEASTRDDGGGCTAFEALAALIWRSWASLKGFRRDDLTKFVTAVNCRRRFDPPLPTGYAGNAMILVKAECRAGDLLDGPLTLAAGLVREAVRRVTETRLRATIDCLYERPLALPYFDERTLAVSSWARLDLLAPDFGWGEPVHALPAFLLPENVMVLSPVAGGRGQLLKLVMPPAEAVEFQKLTKAREFDSNL